jgi:RNA polymerase sigma-70 factor, ECF subfamily
MVQMAESLVGLHTASHRTAAPTAQTAFSQSTSQHESRQTTRQAEQQAERHAHFTRLLKPLADRLLRYAYTLTHNREDAEDIAGEAILRAYEQFETLREEAAFKSWLFTIARRVFMQRLERGKRFVALDMDAHDRPTTAASPAAHTEARLLYEALEHLAPEQRETVALFELVGLSLEEIRAVQGGSLSGVKSRLVRGREKLAQILGAARR